MYNTGGNNFEEFQVSEQGAERVALPQIFSPSKCFE